MSYFVCDFSVTTNCLGTPQDALHAAVAAVKEASHYPSSDQEPALSRVAAFLFGAAAPGEDAAGKSCCGPVKQLQQHVQNQHHQENKEEQQLVRELRRDWREKVQQQQQHLQEEVDEKQLDVNDGVKTGKQKDEEEEQMQLQQQHWNKNKLQQQKANKEQQETPHLSQSAAAACSALRERLLLGNGASELIDLCVRTAGATTWMPGVWDVQYKEYERSAENYGLKRAKSRRADLLCIVNPCNPTGDFLHIDDLKELVEERAADDASVLVDESMLPWYGHDWRSQSLVTQDTWITDIYARRGVRVFVIHSWTKLWACPGLRCGSVLAPTAKEATYLRKCQVPWSVNSVAISFLSKVVEDVAYLEKTWKVTPKWNSEFRSKLKDIQPQWDIFGEIWLPFIWIDTKSAHVAQFYVSICMKTGVPIRWGAHGYQRPTNIRVAVRHPAVSSIVLDAFKTPCPIID